MPKDANKVWRKIHQEKIQQAVLRAEPLLSKGQWDEAEAVIRTIDTDIMGSVAIARMYETKLTQLVTDGMLAADRNQVELFFQRALASWRVACPEPHTAEEADRYEAGFAQDRQRLIAILGYEPSQR